MKHLKTTLLYSLLLVVASVFLFVQHRVQIKLQAENELLRQRIAELEADTESLSNRLAQMDISPPPQALSDDQLNELLKLRGEVTVLQNAANDPTAIAAKAWLLKVNKLKQRMEDTPGAKIPELQFLTEQDWLDVASKKLDTDADYRRALASLRDAAKKKFGEMYQQALQRYSKAGNGQTPSDLAQLQPYFDSPVDDSILQRWQIESAKQFGLPPNTGMGDWVLTEKTAVDEVFDTRFTFGANGVATVPFLDLSIGQTLSPVYKAFEEANNGQDPTTLSQLLPFATTPEQQTALQKQILRASAY